MKDFYFIDSDEKVTKEMIGGKGYYLHDMQSFIKKEELEGVSIPLASFLSTGLWQKYKKDPKKTTTILKNEIIPQIIEWFKKQNSGKMPLISIRSAGAVSMPGMMDTVLNVGINQKYIKENCPKIGSKSEEEEFMADTYAQFLSMYGETVLGIDKKEFPHEKPKDIASVVADYERIYEKNKKQMPSQKIEEQILQCVLAVFNSWDNKRARLYRQTNNIDDLAGTAVVLQQMVFGNKNDLSATGVMFSRNPSNGENELTGEYLNKAQGEAVVAGTHTPKNMDRMRRRDRDTYDILYQFAKALERKYKEVQDIEFTIEDGNVYILQARTAKCSPPAKLKMLIDMYKRKQIKALDVLNNLSLKEYLELNTKQIDSGYENLPDGKGLVGSMGAMHGRAVFSASLRYGDEPTVYIAEQTTPDDLEAILLSKAILTAKGGVTSHAAVVARAMGKVCIVGCEDLKISTDKNGNITAKISGKEIKDGDWITMDANTGRVWLGKDVPIVDASDSEMFWDLEDLVIDSKKWTRLTSDVDELELGKERFFMTYNLDDADDDFLKEEIGDATQYLTGIMDMTGKFDYMIEKGDNSFPFAKEMAEKVFLRKKEALLSWAKDNFDAEYDFKLYLGVYEKEHASSFKLEGFKIISSKEVAFESNNKEAKYIVSSKVQDYKDKKTAISSKNALLGVLK